MLYLKTVMKCQVPESWNTIIKWNNVGEYSTCPVAAFGKPIIFHYTPQQLKFLFPVEMRFWRAKAKWHRPLIHASVSSPASFSPPPFSRDRCFPPPSFSRLMVGISVFSFSSDTTFMLGWNRGWKRRWWEIWGGEWPATKGHESLL